MRRNDLRPGIMMIAACLLAACSDSSSVTDPDDDGSNNNNNNGGAGSTRMTATVDGKAWSAGATPGGVVALQPLPKSGGYLIMGVELSGSGVIGATMTININNVSGPGTYTLGVDAVSTYGGFAGITSSTGGTWLTPLSGSAGTITITTLTTTRIAGSFSYTASAVSGGATGTRIVTNGIFDAPISGNAVLPVLTDSMGGKLSGTLSGQPWNAAIISAGTTATHLSLSGINDRQTLVFTIPKPAGAGTYQLSNAAGSILLAWDPSAVAPAGARCCYGIAGDVGSITFTSLTTTRAKGVLSATLRAQPGTTATGQLVITGGTFDVGLFHKP
jgi:hypothetical protein